ncbi:DUF2339 domain-containing protein [Nocardia sp. NPDC050710]|uniref:DUF2339 domain-containing protein n=1 Tax=Nocardia sp. NPDC050710 TaxID=3157220 RepID=UPI0033D8F7DC
MTTSIDPALITRLSGEFTALGTRMTGLGQDLELLRAQVLASAQGAVVAREQAPGSTASADDIGAAAPPPGPAQVSSTVPQPPGVPADAAAPMAPGTASPPPGVPRMSAAPVPPPAALHPVGGMPTAAYGPVHMPPGGVRWGVPVPPRTAPPGWRPPAPPVRGPAVARTPWWQQEGVISRILAVAGVGVTLIGVVMLLVLAAQAGFFGPVPRVIAGTAFSVALVAAGLRVFGRAGGRVGGIALAATGIAGAYLDVVAVTTMYDWLHPALGLAVAFAVAAGGVALAMEWKSQPLAVLVVAGAGVLSPVVTSELVLLAFLIVLQLSCLPVQLVRDWPFLHVTRTVPAVLATLGSIAVAGFDEPAPEREYWLLAAAVAIAAVGLIGTILVVRRRPSDMTATLTLGLAATPLLAAPVLFGRGAAVAIAASFAAVLLAVATTNLVPKLRAVVRIPGHTAIVAAVAGSFALLEVCFGVTDVQTLPIALFLVAVAYLGVAGQRRSRAAAGIGAAFAGLGAIVFFLDATPETLATQRLAEQRLDISTVLAAVLALAVVAVAVWGLRKLPNMSGGDTEESMLWIFASAIGLYAVTAATVALGVTSAAADGFVIGHSAATILWMAAATAALLYGLRNLSRSDAVAKVALGSGLLVTAAALAKLFLFDLATLDGLVRVAAFLVVGVLLLLAGTRYARAFAETHSEA